MTDMCMDFFDNFDDASFDIIEAIDTDGDGVADSLFIDFDGDGVGDAWLADSDFDGVFDSIIGDFDSDGIMDVFEFDTDEIGGFEQEYDFGVNFSDMDENNPDAISVDIYEEFGYIDSDDDDRIIGDVTDAMDSWHSQTGNTCAVCSQEFILEDLLDREFTEGELTEVAEANGWFNDGTPVEDVGNLLEYYGIRTERSEGNTLNDLRDSLADGNKVIVGVDSDELWSGQDNDLFGPGMDADHAIQVVGIDERVPDDIRVIINDSGVANGRCVSIPADVFVDAWEDGNCFMVEAFDDSFEMGASSMLGTVQV